MTRESFAFAVSGIVFGFLIGWILGSQRDVPAGPAPVAAAGGPQVPAESTPPSLDVQRAAVLERQANAEPGNAAVRVDLGNLYFDANRFDVAATWYEAALKLDPRNVNASTDLGVSYYQSNQADRALSQFDHSLSIDPGHAKTLFNVGIVRAFGKMDLEGAARAWEQLIAIAPNTPEAARAREALATLRTSHPGGASTPAAGRGGRGGQ